MMTKQQNYIETLPREQWGIEDSLPLIDKFIKENVVDDRIDTYKAIAKEEGAKKRHHNFFSYITCVPEIMAVFYNDKEALEKLIEQDPEIVQNDRYCDGYRNETLTHCALDNPEMLKVLLNNGADINGIQSGSREDVTLLAHAIDTGNAEAVEMLASLGANSAYVIEEIDDDILLPFMIFPSETPTEDAVRIVKAMCEHKVSYYDDLLEALSSRSHTKYCKDADFPQYDVLAVAEAIIDTGAEIKEDAVVEAIVSGRPDILGLLLEKGGKISPERAGKLFDDTRNLEINETLYGSYPQVTSEDRQEAFQILSQKMGQEDLKKMVADLEERGLAEEFQDFISPETEVDNCVVDSKSKAAGSDKARGA